MKVIKLSELEPSTISYIKLDLLKYLIAKEKLHNKIFNIVIGTLTIIISVITLLLVSDIFIKLYGAF